MQTYRLIDIIKGWFVGLFEPAVLHTLACEVAVKRYPAGHLEPIYMHRMATEITVIISGQAEMAGRVLDAGDVIRVDPGEATGFHTLTEVTTTDVKVPGALGDKFLVVGEGH